MIERKLNHISASQIYNTVVYLRDRNLNAGKITGYQNAKEAINEHSL